MAGMAHEHTHDGRHDHEHGHDHDHDHSEIGPDGPARARAGNRARGQGLYRPGRARRPDRHLPDPHRPAQRRARGRQGLVRPGVPRLAAGAMPPRPSPRWATAAARASTWWRVENTPQRAQPGGLHAVQLLPLAGARACRRPGTRARPTARARCATRAACWPTSASRCPSRHRDPRLGLHRRSALPGDPAAAGRHRRHRRRAAGRAGHARLDDRHRPGASPGAAA